MQGIEMVFWLIIYKYYKLIVNFFLSKKLVLIAFLIFII